MRQRVFSAVFSFSLITVVVALLLGCSIAHAQLTSFETLPGSEPTMHLSDPDLGVEMDWFRVASGKWAIVELTDTDCLRSPEELLEMPLCTSGYGISSGSGFAAAVRANRLRLRPLDQGERTIPPLARFI